MWVAVHFYHENRSGELLSNLVLPLSRSALKAKVALRFFFINYFDDDGLHIRLRFEVEEQRRITAIAKVQRLIESCLKENMPLKSYKFMEYEPEVERYGGSMAIELAEEHFYHSSKAVLQYLREGRIKPGAEGIAKALDMHICLIYHLPCPADLVEGMLRRILDHWIHSSVAYHRTIIPSKTDEIEIMANVTDAFTKSFEKQRNGIVAHCAALWQALQAGEKLGTPLDAWNAGLQQMHLRLTVALENTVRPDETVARALVIYESYIHMTNNRLGISNSDEAFLAYILLQVWQHIRQYQTPIKDAVRE